MIVNEHKKPELSVKNKKKKKQMSFQSVLIFPVELRQWQKEEKKQ